MSGLSVFFRRCLTTSADPNAASVSDPSSTSRPESLGGDATERPDDTVADDADETMVDDLYDQSVLMWSQRFGREKPRSMDVPSSFKEWRNEQCNLLQEYLVQRLFAPVATESSDDLGRAVEEGMETGPCLETAVDSILETQIEDVPPSHGEKDPPSVGRQGVLPTAASASSLGRSSQNSIIPNVSETYFIASHLSKLDLYVQRSFIPVVEVTKVWHLRSTLERRRQVSHHSSERFQYDGPLATVYASVLSMEVRQTGKEFAGEDETLRRHTEQIHTVSRLLDEASIEHTAANGPQPQHCEIFWYDTYAKAMDSILVDTNECVPSSRNSTMPQVELYLSLENVPAKCIFPYYSASNQDKWMRPADWYDSHHTSPYCLCIGGKSSVECQMQNTGNEEYTTTQRIRFDTNMEDEPSNLCIRCWVVVLPLVVSAHLTEAALLRRANVMIPSKILEYEIGPEDPMKKSILDCTSDDDAVLLKMKKIWDNIEKHHKKERIVAPVLAAPAVAPTAPAAAQDAMTPFENVDSVPRAWATPQRDAGLGISTPIARNPSAITGPAENEPLLQQLMTPGERMKQRRMDVHLNFQYQKLVRLCIWTKSSCFGIHVFHSRSVS
jgi:hypothetical protein